MRIFFFGCVLMTVLNSPLAAQRACSSMLYKEQQLEHEPDLRNSLATVENFIQQQIRNKSLTAARGGRPLVKIPVVIHILYNQAAENISNEKILSQLEALNQCFRRNHPDSVNTPERFRPLAADCQIEFALATSDPQRRFTTGIIRKFTPVTKWTEDDQVKFSSRAGDDAWDARNYLNIWVCNLGKAAGYSSLPGGAGEKDGVVIGSSYFGIGSTPGFEWGKTAVHEIGHWLGLRHTWGDEYCGDDLVADTPKQGNFTSGCPNGVIRLSCDNAPNGDMYMNYMDFTLDGCTNLFTEGQKARMQALFQPGGPRYTLLSSYGLEKPLFSEIPLQEDAPNWLHPQLYPNPASAELTLDLSYDVRWVGKVITITTAQGQVAMRVVIDTKIQRINISRLSPGFYFLSGKKEDGSLIQQKFIKM